MFKHTIFVAGLFALALTSGCAVIDRTMLKPAAEASRVPPLVRSYTCSSYEFPTGDKSAADPTSWNNPLFKNDCEGQEETIKSEELTTRCGANADLKECAAFLERKSESICSVHLSKIFGNRAVTNVAIGTLAAATGIAGGLVSGGAANALSGSAGFLTADRSLFNEEVYRNYVAEAVIKEIQKNREAAKIDIAEAIAKGAGAERNSPRAITGPEQVIQRVSEMHEGCSFYAGLTSLLGKAGQDDYAVNLKTGVSAQLESLKTARAATVDKLARVGADATLDAAGKATEAARLEKALDAIDGQIASYTLTLNLMAPGYVSMPAVTAPAVPPPAAGK